MNRYISKDIYKNEKSLVAAFLCSQGPPAQSSWDAGGPAPRPPPWDRGSGARLQGNAATNPFPFLYIYIYIYMFIYLYTMLLYIHI